MNNQNSEQMKNPISLYLASLLILVLPLSCDDDLHDNDPEISNVTGKLKRVLLYENIDSAEPLSVVEVYEYDKQGRISKVFTPNPNNETIEYFKYDEYEYNINNQLVVIREFNANLNSETGYINLINTKYEYNTEGLKAKEIKEYPRISSSEYTLFFYAQALLIRTEEYDNANILLYYTENEYNIKGQLIKESGYSASGELIHYTVHEYNDKLLSKSLFYSADFKLIREEYRTYSDSGKLIILESKENNMMSSRISSVLRFEYE